MFTDDEINFFIFLRLLFTFYESIQFHSIFLRLHPNYLIRRNSLRL